MHYERDLKWTALLLLSAGFAYAGVGPQGVRVEARMLHGVSTYRAKNGTPAAALVTTPLCRADGAALPDGTALEGRIERVRRVGLGLIHETASLQLVFDRLHLPDEKDIPVDARLLAIDSARERIDRRGVIHGVRSTATWSNRLGQRLAFLAMDHPAAIAPLFVLENGVFRFPDPEIEYRRGTELYLQLLAEDEEAGLHVCPATPSPVGEGALEDLRRMVDDLPYWSQSRRQPQPMDLVNLIFVGPEAALRRAFEAAGWTGSVDNSVKAGIEAIRAVAGDVSYREAPMRTLLLDGSEPDLRLQKSLNTFEKRHHLRIWKRNGEWQGRPVWASAATQDVSTTFSMRPFGFTHEIENEVDLERDKVVSDLQFTGCIDSVRYIARPDPVRASGQPYRRGVTTDGRIAVVTFNACEAPRISPRDSAPGEPPPGVVRCIRRIALTARNHFLRDNIFGRAGDAARMGILALRHWDEQRKDERRARRADLAAVRRTLP